MKRKGVSPLIATVLLLVVTIVIGVIVFTWLKGYVGTTTQDVGKKLETQMRCDMAIGGLQILKIENVEKICYNPGSIVFGLENGMDMDVKSIFVRVIDNNGNVSAGYINNSEMRKGDAKFFTYTDANMGRPVQVVIMPSDYEDKLCSKAGVTRENINPC